jgi:hypothetical protein
VSRKTRKNLEAAIAAAKKPGYFSYYQPPPAVKQSMRDNVLGTRLAELNQVSEALVELEEEMVTAAAHKKAALEEHQAPQVNSLAEWFGHYGEPQRKEGTGPGWRTQIDKSKKVYGGTKHHMPFKTVATTQRPGRLTR